MRYIKVLKSKKKNKSIVRKILEITVPPLAMLLLMSILVTVVSLVLSQPTLTLKTMDSLKIYFTDINIFLFNLYPILIVTLLLYLLFNRTWVSLFISSFLFIALGIINILKLQYMNSPLYVKDFRYIRELCMGLNDYGASISSKIYILIVVIIFILIFLKMFFDYRIDSKTLRLSYIIILGIWSIILYRTDYREVTVNSSLKNINNKSEFYIDNGFVNSFVRDIGKTSSKRADKDIGKSILDRYKNHTIDSKINIITVELEDYSDFREFKDVNIDEAIYSNYDRVRKDSIRGSLIVNEGSLRTEREYLTGFVEEAIYSSKTNSHVWYFKENEYITEYMINGNLIDFNRLNTNRYLGFDTSTSIEGHSLSKSIIDSFKASVEKDKPYFNFTKLSLRQEDRKPVKSYVDNKNLSKRQEDIFNLYLDRINNIDEEIGELVKYFKEEERPTILVFMGTGSPELGKNQEIYDNLGINVDTRTKDGFLNKYRTPYMIWGNNSARVEFNKSFVKEEEDYSPNFLLANIFDYLDIRGNAYIQYLNDKKEDYTVNNIFYFRNKNGYIKTEEIPKYIIDSYSEFKDVENYYENNFKKDTIKK